MEREILFRGKDKIGSWHEGSLINKHKPTEKEKVLWCSLIHDGALSVVEVIPETVGQFTGLCDKNGVKTYDSDICRSPSHFENGILMYNYHVIKWSDKYCGWFAKNIGNIGKKDTHGDVQLWVYFKNCEPEVIGSIYDNQELLKDD